MNRINAKQGKGKEKRKIRRKKRKSKKKEDGDAQKGRNAAIHCDFPII